MHDKSTPPFEPKEFGRYLLVDRLAIGGMAEILTAKTLGARGFEKTVVIKRILPHLADDPEFAEMFVDEAKLMARLTHPNIVQVLDFGEIDEQYFMALEYIEGIDGLALLRQCARRRCRPTTSIVVHIMAEILDALAFAHNVADSDQRTLGVVHRDISPANILISWLGDAKLGDFGIARLTVRQGRTEDGTLKGKYGYMAPEQVTGGHVDHRADIFSVGVVLAELLMIRRLFYAKNDLETLLQVRDAQLGRLEKYGTHIAPELRGILESALARDPDLRYQSAGAFRDALHQYLYGQRHMVRAEDVRHFLLRLTEDDKPLSPGARPLASGYPAGGAPAWSPLEPQGSALQPHHPSGGGADSGPALPEPGESTAGRRRGSRPAYLGGYAREEAAPPATAESLAYGGAPQGSGGGPRAGDQQGAPAQKRRLVLAPPEAAPHPRRQLDEDQLARLSTADALAAVPEMVGATSSRSDFARDHSRPPEEVVARRPKVPPTGMESASAVAARMTTGGPAAQEPVLAGDLDDFSLFRALFELAVAERTGLLVIEWDKAVKEVYLVDGDPQFVTSNQANELFGQYLVGRGIISAGELSMALAMLPHFRNKLGDALVALKLLRPVAVLRHLTQQVRQKLLDAFLWETGRFQFFAETQCERECAPLGLDAFEVIGAAVRAIPMAQIAERLGDKLGHRIQAVKAPAVPPEAFRLGSLPRSVYDKLTGRATLAELLAPFDEPSQREAFIQMAYLLIETGLACCRPS